MIENGFTYIALLLFIASSILYFTVKTQWKIFDYLPAVVIIYFSVMILSGLDIWQKNEEIKAYADGFKTSLLYSMIFLMLSQANLKDIASLGTKMLLSYFLATLSITIGFIVMFALLHNSFSNDAYMTFSSLNGCWIGGTGNMIAIQKALSIEDSQMGNILITDAFNYTLLVIFILWSVSIATKFDLWSKAGKLHVKEPMVSEQESKAIDFSSLFLLLGLSIMISSLSQIIASYMPTTSFLSRSTWEVLIATLFGIAGSFTFVRHMAGLGELGNIMLYFIIALIASQASFAQLSDAPLYIFAGFLVIFIHLALMVIFAKIFKLNLAMIGIASVANVGGPASASIVASAYDKSLVPFGVIMGLIGYMIGTFIGIGVSTILKVIAQ
ncbi:MAG: membrane protein [Sulfurovum sp. AS07-7]|nr:MAG: membrane protein [Sulfurovum sp. AS07-7]